MVSDHGAMTTDEPTRPNDPTHMTEAERLDSLAAMQKLERLLRKIWGGKGPASSHWNEDVDEIYSDLLQDWLSLKVELELDEGPHAHIGRDFLARDGDGASSPPEDEPVGQPRDG